MSTDSLVRVMMRAAHKRGFELSASDAAVILETIFESGEDGEVEIDSECVAELVGIPVKEFLLTMLDCGRFALREMEAKGMTRLAKSGSIVLDAIAEQLEAEMPDAPDGGE